MRYIIESNKDRYYTIKAIYYGNLINELTVFSKNLDKTFKEFKEDSLNKLELFKRKLDLIEALDKINNKDYILVDEMVLLLKEYNKLYYHYDILGVGSIYLKEDNVQLRDIIGDVYIIDYDYKFYKDAIELYGGFENDKNLF